MKMFTGCNFRRRRAFVRLAGSTALTAALLTALPLASPANGADLEYGYGERREYRVPAYPPEVRYSEQYEYRVPAYPQHGEDDEAPLEYRVLVYPPKVRYGYRGRPAYPPAGHSEHRYEQEYEYGYDRAPDYSAHRSIPNGSGYRHGRVYRPDGYADHADEPYRRRYVEEPLLPPGLVGPRRLVVEASRPGEWREPPPRW